MPEPCTRRRGKRKGRSARHSGGRGARAPSNDARKHRPHDLACRIHGRRASAAEAIKADSGRERCRPPEQKSRVPNQASTGRTTCGRATLPRAAERCRRRQRPGKTNRSRVRRWVRGGSRRRRRPCSNRHSVAGCLHKTAAEARFAPCLPARHSNMIRRCRRAEHHPEFRNSRPPGAVGMEPGLLSTARRFSPCVWGRRSSQPASIQVNSIPLQRAVQSASRTRWAKRRKMMG